MTATLPHRAAAGAAGWTDDRMDLLKRLWREGLSASQIAKQLGGVTRNGVIGKIHRLGLSGRSISHLTATRALVGRGRRSDAQPVNPDERRPAPPRRVLPPIPEADRVVIDFKAEEPGAATLLTLDAHMCKWPIGDPALPNFTFCGRRADVGSYCNEHARLAHQPGQAKTSANELARSLRKYL